MPRYASPEPDERTVLLPTQPQPPQVPIIQLPSPQKVSTPLPTPNNNEKKRISPLELPWHNKVLLLIGVWTATSLASLNMTMVATLMSSISSSFGASNQSAWLGTSFLLATTAFTPLYGRLCNILGRKWANLTALCLFGLGTTMCGFATSLEGLILARFIAGIGGGGLGITSSVIAADLFSLRQRSLLQGISAVFNGAGTGLGGPFGGYMADRFGWRWAFLAQLPIFALSFGLSVWNNKYYTPGRGASTWEMIRRIDWAGSACLLVFVLNLLLFLSFKFNSESPWSSPEVIITFCGMIAFAGIFILTQLYVSPEPVLSRKLLKMKTPMIVAANNFLVAVCNFGVTFYFPVWFETVALESAGEAGLHLLPNALASSTGSLFAGWIMSRTGKYKTLSNIFGIVPACAAVGIALMHSGTSQWLQWVSIVPLGFGNAVVFQTTLIALLASVGSGQVAVATGFAGLFRCIGQVSGVAFGAAFFQSLLLNQLQQRITGPDAESLITKIRHDAKIVPELPSDLKEEARQSYAYALRAVFIFCAICTSLAFVVRLPMPEHSLDEPPTASRPGSPDSEESEEDKSSEEEDEEAAIGVSSETSVETPTDVVSVPVTPRSTRPRVRRYSTYETGDGFAYPQTRPKLHRRKAAVRSVSERPTGGRSRSRIRDNHDGRGVMEEQEPMAFSLPTADPIFVQEREGHLAHRRTSADADGDADREDEGEPSTPVNGHGRPMAFSLPPPSPGIEDWATQSHHHHFYGEEVHWLPEAPEVGSPQGSSPPGEEALWTPEREAVRSPGQWSELSGMSGLGSVLESDGEEESTPTVGTPKGYFPPQRR
ncbi:MFS general substrate transporter [Dacryopinax primogenitus]|uniref:MFS general substrate transporter n=1 Tax=Dacryopinax primogenitus (strain DJM 731) TaxID=1858805 RepID=M5GDF8_DACPD|nr:MFS general substrate transporter [Dacryopinax primogenitus]EJU04497.1 MFS general substrate transporter [Dacryopinax primogenitus]